MLYGLQAWVPTFLVRAHDWDLARAGRVYGMIALVAGSAGVLSGPYLGNWLRRRGYEDYPLRVAVIGAGFATVGLVAVPWPAQAELALALVALASFAVTLPMALVTYALQTATPNLMRGVVAGLYVVTVNVMGLALGPTLVALATDYVFQDTQAVGYSLALVSAVMGPMAMVLVGSGLRPYARMTTMAIVRPAA
jgi:MFS family permease